MYLLVLVTRYMSMSTFVYSACTFIFLCELFSNFGLTNTMHIMSVTIVISSFIVVMTHQVGLTGCVVLLCAHANQAIIVEENAKWVTGGD